MTFREAMSPPIENLIESRLAEMGLRRPELISRLGHKNISRGLRSLARPSAGDLDGYSGLIAKLPSALQLDPEAVQKVEVDEVWGPAGKVEWGPLVGETAPTTQDERQEARGKSEAARQARHEGDFLSRRSGR
jgi:hypothetical protein